MRKENPRMDIATRERHEKSELFRFVVSDGRIALDLDSSMPGRGIYLYKSKEAIEKARRKRLFSRFGQIEDEDSFYEKLVSLLENEGD